MKRELIFMLAILGMVAWMVGCKDKEEAKHEVVNPPVYTPPSVTIQADHDNVYYGEMVNLTIGIVRGSNAIAALEIGFVDSTRIDTVLPNPQGDTFIIRHCLFNAEDNYPVVRVNDGASELRQAVCHIHQWYHIDDPPFIFVAAPDTAWVGDSVLIRIGFGTQGWGNVIDTTLAFGCSCGGSLDRIDTLYWDPYYHHLRLKWYFGTSGMCPFVATIGAPLNYCPPTDTSTYVLWDTAYVRVLEHQEVR